jgi:hypothetical protein
MAAPHVAGFAAILLSEKNYTPRSLKAAIKASAVMDKITDVPANTMNALLNVTPSQIKCPLNASKTYRDCICGGARIYNNVTRKCECQTTWTLVGGQCESALCNRRGFVNNFNPYGPVRQVSYRFITGPEAVGKFSSGVQDFSIGFLNDATSVLGNLTFGPMSGGRLQVKVSPKSPFRPNNDAEVMLAIRWQFPNNTVSIISHPVPYWTAGSVSKPEGALDTFNFIFSARFDHLNSGCSIPYSQTLASWFTA